MFQIIRRIQNNPTGSKRMILSLYNYLFPQVNEVHVRNYSTNNPIISDEIADSFHPKLKTIFQQLDSIAPRFVLNKGDIQILTHPVEFYESLKEKLPTQNPEYF